MLIVQNKDKIEFIFHDSIHIIQKNSYFLIVESLMSNQDSLLLSNVRVYNYGFRSNGGGELGAAGKSDFRRR